MTNLAKQTGFMFFALLLFAAGCDFSSVGSSSEITISGTVVDRSTGNGINSAIVRIVSPQDIARSTSTDASGSFIFEGVAVEDDTDITIEATKEGFDIVTITVLAIPDRDSELSPIELIPEGSGGGGDDTDGGGDQVGGESGGAASISLVNVTNEAINIEETGGDVNSAFTFAVQDSAGRNIDLDKAVDIEFEILSGPAGAAITPEVVRTNAQGRATSNLFSGNEAGPVKIEARVVRSDIGLTIRSKPVVIAIHGGFPDLEHFSIAVNQFNFEGFSVNGVRNPVTVIVGDKFSNPVKPGTPVSFQTTGGVIQGSGETDDDGIVTVDLISGDPRPTHPQFGLGYATVTATTVDENDSPISRDITVLFSAPPSNGTITVTPSTFDIPANGSQAFTATITDINGNPLPAGTTITVTASEGLVVNGDSDVAVPNTLFGGEGVTEFSFSVVDDDDESDAQQDGNVTILVETPGGFSARKTISGTRAKSF